MNTSTLKIALNASNAAWNQFKKYRDEKAIQAYERLSEAAESVGGVEGLRERGSELLDDSRREAGNVTKSARARLNKALDDAQAKGQELAERGQQVAEDTRKNGKKKQRKAVKAAAQGRKEATRAANRTQKKTAKQIAKLGRNKQDKQQGTSKWLVFGLVSVLIAAVGGGVYWFLNRKPAPGTTPPRVEEHGGGKTESTLVYSTETPAEVEPAKGKLQSEEELLASLDDQLDKHRAEEAVGDTAEQDESTVADAAAEAVANAEEATAEAEEDEEPVANEELLEEGEEIQAEYDKHNAPHRDQSDK
ncbi:hypothetical protein [Corynebacterium halotolerans]|uniref:hypothetical protein n=1 Tax=Corynebacterium halotolerans TaxID=225326 RepID=UPI003CEF588D